MNCGRYQIEKELGSGAMGVVYLARDPQIGRLVAVKILRQDRVVSDEFVKRFLKEAKVIGRLSHPGIVTIFDMGEEQGTIYIAMEFLEGQSLSDIMSERRLDVREVVDLGIQLAETIDYAHRRGIVHRDIKPSNIIVNPEGRTKITDFGIARIEDATATVQTQAGEIMGTPAYMSPEQVTGHVVDGRSDIFSLGVILYEMSTGRRPFGGTGKSLMTIFNEILQVSPAEPAVESPSVPKALSALVMKALRKERENRFRTGGELAEALKQCLLEIEATAPEPTPAPEPSAAAPVWDGARKKGGLVLPIAVAAALVAAAGYYAITRHSPTPVAPPAAMNPNPSTPAPSSAPVPADPPLPAPTPPAAASAAPSSPASAGPPATTRRSNPPRAEAKRADSDTKRPSAKVRTPDTGSVAVTLLTTPPGARVFVDDAAKGNTPLTTMLPTGSHRIRVSLPGYRDQERRVTLEDTMEYPVSFRLEAAGATAP